MNIRGRDEVTHALRLRFEEDRRYQILRALLPISEWPLCIYDPGLTADARQERQNERREAGTLARDIRVKRTAEDDQAVYDDLLARVRVPAEENEMLWTMHEAPLVAWEAAALQGFAREMLEREAACTYAGERRLLHMDLSTLAWVLGLPAGENDEATLAALRRELGVTGTAREQQETPGSDTPLCGSYPGSREAVLAAHPTGPALSITAGDLIVLEVGEHQLLGKEELQGGMQQANHAKHKTGRGPRNS